MTNEQRKATCKMSDSFPLNAEWAKSRYGLPSKKKDMPSKLNSLIVRTLTSEEEYEIDNKV